MENKFNRNEFIKNTERNLTDEQCKEWFTNNKTTNYSVSSQWSYGSESVYYGSTSLTFDSYSPKTGMTRQKKFENHPSWRPLGHYEFFTRGWNGKSIKVEAYIQSWEECKNISDSDNFTISLMKHPHQC